MRKSPTPSSLRKRIPAKISLLLTSIPAQHQLLGARRRKQEKRAEFLRRYYYSNHSKSLKTHGRRSPGLLEKKPGVKVGFTFSPRLAGILTGGRARQRGCRFQQHGSPFPYMGVSRHSSFAQHLQRSDDRREAIERTIVGRAE